MSRYPLVGHKALRSVPAATRGARGVYRGGLPVGSRAVRSGGFYAQRELHYLQRDLRHTPYSSGVWSRHSSQDVSAKRCVECEKLRTELGELRRKYSDLEDRYHELLQRKQEEAASPPRSLVQPKSGAMQHERSGQAARYKVGISYETSQQQGKYSRMAGKVVQELGLRSSVQQGARPEDLYDIVLHFARTDGGRTVDLDPEKRRAFSCKHVILVLLRSGKNEAVFRKFVPVSKLEYSGINLGSHAEKKTIVQLLHWQGEWVTSKLNNDNLQLLKELMREACPGIVPP